VCACVFPITLGQLREAKNSLIMLKFDTLGDWINTWGMFFSIFQNLIEPLGVFYGITYPAKSFRV